MSTLKVNNIIPYTGDTVYIDAILDNPTINELSTSFDARIIAATNEQDLSSFETIANVEALSASIATTDGNITTSITNLSSSVNSRFNIIENGKYPTTGSNVFNGNQTITGSLYVSANLIVQGSSSIQNISSSTLNIGTNLITVNAQNPSVRFGGLAVIDSGSSPVRSGSMLFDSVENQWIYVHQGNTVVTSSLLIMAAETYNNVGNEIHPTTNRIMKSIVDEHIGDSNISDNGTKVTIDVNTDITGSLRVTSAISASTFTGLGNLTLFSSSIDNQLNALEAVTGSLITSASANRISITNLNAATSSYETKGRGIVSGSSQITLSSTTGFTTFSSSVATSIATIPQIPFTEVISKTSVSNPSNYTLYSFPTASYNGAKLVFVATERSGETPSNRSTTFEILIAQGNNLVTNIQTYQIKSQSTSPAPTITTVISGGNVLVRITESGTFNYSGYIQLF